MDNLLPSGSSSFSSAASTLLFALRCLARLFLYRLSSSRLLPHKRPFCCARQRLPPSTTSSTSCRQTFRPAHCERVQGIAFRRGQLKTRPAAAASSPFKQRLKWIRLPSAHLKLIKLARSASNCFLSLELRQVRSNENNPSGPREGARSRGTRQKNSSKLRFLLPLSLLSLKLKLFSS